jgi:hypothetical protein
MGTIKMPLPVKLIMSMFTGETALFEQALEALTEQFGPADYGSTRMPFVHTEYYTPEFGASLQRQFITFERLVDPGNLVAIKHFTNALEQCWSQEGKRRMNLDPGYVSSAKLVLATTKDHSHRIYLGQGIYAEITLSYHHGDWRALPWTYPDYASDAYRAILREVRALYMAQLQALRAG